MILDYGFVAYSVILYCVLWQYAFVLYNTLPVMLLQNFLTMVLRCIHTDIYNAVITFNVSQYVYSLSI